jgi:protein-tyrosine phosphatase
MSSAAAPLRVQFVCTGNICRSPLAEIVFRDLAVAAGFGDAVQVSSSGTGGWHVGDGADPRAVDVLAAHGHDGTGHRARRFRRADFDDADVIVALDTTHLRDLRALAPDSAARARIRLLMDSLPGHAGEDVPDPYYGAPQDFERVYALVAAASRALLTDLPLETTAPAERMP